jgi:hypothetical protein
MNAAELHLAINHLPLAGTIFGVIILLVSLFVHSDGVRLTGLALLIASGIFSIPTVSTGEDAEEIVEHMGLGEEVHDYIHEHEEIAEGARTVSLIVALLAAVAFYFTYTKRAPGKLFAILTLAGGIGSLVYLGNAAHTGGEIRHTEIREGFVVPGDDHDDGH